MKQLVLLSFLLSLLLGCASQPFQYLSTAKT